MGANAQTSVPTFTAGDVLTAANMNISARTGVPVFADTTARDAGFGGAGEKTLAEGQLCYVENLTGDQQIQYYDGTSWNSLSASGLTLISSTTIGTAVSSVTVSNVFSSTYDNYKIMISGGAASTATNFSLVFGATTTGYYYGSGGASYVTGNFASAFAQNAASFLFAGGVNTDGLSMSLDVIAPNLAKNTFVMGPAAQNQTTGTALMFGGYLANTTAYTAFTIGVGAATITGGTIQVYGYKK